MNTQNQNELTQSRMGIAASIVGATMLATQLGILAAVAMGVKDNQGVIFAFSIPAVMYLVGVPLGLVTAAIGFVQKNRKLTAAKWGLVLTLLSPLVFLAWYLSR